MKGEGRGQRLGVVGELVAGKNPSRPDPNGKKSAAVPVVQEKKYALNWGKARIGEVF